MLANRLKAGDTIGVIAPDKALKSKDIQPLENATRYFESLGLKVKYGNIYSQKIIIVQELQRKGQKT